jgi:hypothetical protein
LTAAVHLGTCSWARLTSFQKDPTTVFWFATLNGDTQ